MCSSLQWDHAGFHSWILREIIAKHNVSFHCYADDLQVYLPLDQNDTVALNYLFGCSDDIKLWHNTLHLNADKTSCIIFQSNRVSALSSCDALVSVVNTAVRDLGFISDDSIRFDKNIHDVLKMSYSSFAFWLNSSPFLASVIWRMPLVAQDGTVVTCFYPHSLIIEIPLLPNAAAYFLNNWAHALVNNLPFFTRYTSCQFESGLISRF